MRLTRNYGASYFIVQTITGDMTKKKTREKGRKKEVGETKGAAPYMAIVARGKKAYKKTDLRPIDRPQNNVFIASKNRYTVTKTLYGQLCPISFNSDID